MILHTETHRLLICFFIYIPLKFPINIQAFRLTLQCEIACGHDSLPLLILLKKRFLKFRSDKLFARMRSDIRTIHSNTDYYYSLNVS